MNPNDGLNYARAQVVVDSEEDVPPPDRTELQGMHAGRHPDLFSEEEEVQRCVRNSHPFSTEALVVNVVGAAQTVSARLALWGYPDAGVPSTLEAEVADLAGVDGAYRRLLAVITPAITRLLAAEFLIMRRATDVNSEYLTARALLQQRDIDAVRSRDLLAMKRE